jgi:hypothetical protein
MGRQKRKHDKHATDVSGHLACVTIKDFKSLKDVSVDLGQTSVDGQNRPLMDT